MLLTLRLRMPVVVERSLTAENQTQEAALSQSTCFSPAFCATGVHAVLKAFAMFGDALSLLCCPPELPPDTLHNSTRTTQGEEAVVVYILTSNAARCARAQMAAVTHTDR